MKFQYKPHQITGSDFLFSKKKGLLADQPRVGKTASAMRATNLAKPEITVIVCPAHLRTQWVKEVETWRDGEWTAVVCSYNKLPEVVKRLRTAGFKPDVVVIDESHYAKERSAKRTKAVYGITCNQIGGIVENVEYVYCLTGTPQPHSPLDLWPMLRALAPELISDPKRQGRPYTYSGWKSKFCKLIRTPFGVKIGGAKNTKLLREIMDQFSLRRTRAEVFGRDIQPATTLYVKAEAGTDRELHSLANSEAGRVVAEVLKNGGGLRELSKKQSEVGSVRRLIGLAKVPGVANIVSQELLDEPDKKIVLFCFHHDVIDATKAALKPFGPLVIDGRLPERLKQKNKALFQDRGSRHRVIICQIEATKVGYDLSAANDTLFIEQSWVGDDNEQAMSRVFNMNKDEPCFTRFAVLSGSVDEDIVQAATRKVNDSEKVFGRQANDKAERKTSGRGARSYRNAA